MRTPSTLATTIDTGGDRRGQQSAALLIVRDKGGYEGFSDRYVDLRVDENERPIDELKRVFDIYDMTMLSREDPSSLLPIDPELAIRIQENLKKLGMYNGPVTAALDDSTKRALRAFVNVHNFENKMHEEGKIWKTILKYMDEQADKTRTAR